MKVLIPVLAVKVHCSDLITRLISNQRIYSYQYAN